jgi:hypothetical protein
MMSWLPVTEIAMYLKENILGDEGNSLLTDPEQQLQERSLLVCDLVCG